jgi:hypothetical protein
MREIIPQLAHIIYLFRIEPDGPCHRQRGLKKAIQGRSAPMAKQRASSVWGARSSRPTIPPLRHQAQAQAFVEETAAWIIGQLHGLPPADVWPILAKVVADIKRAKAEADRRS